MGEWEAGAVAGEALVVLDIYLASECACERASMEVFSFRVSTSVRTRGTKSWFLSSEQALSLSASTIVAMMRAYKMWFSFGILS